jgi:hypothetical protein
MTPKIKNIISSNSNMLEDISPTELIDSIPVEIEIGPDSSQSTDLFQAQICSQEWLAREVAHELIDMSSGVGWGPRPLIFMKEYSYEKLISFLEFELAKLQAPTWFELAHHLSAWMLWECEDYSKR